jgi:sulfur-carrier protein
MYRVASKNLPLISKVETKSGRPQPHMPRVKFTSALKRFFPALDEVDVEASTVHDLLVKLEQKHPGLSSYLVDESGQLRQHVNVFVKDELIRDREKLSDTVQKNDVVFIFQALSGG